MYVTVQLKQNEILKLTDLFVVSFIFQFIHSFIHSFSHCILTHSFTRWGLFQHDNSIIRYLWIKIKIKIKINIKINIKWRYRTRPGCVLRLWMHNVICMCMYMCMYMYTYIETLSSPFCAWPFISMLPDKEERPSSSFISPVCLAPGVIVVRSLISPSDWYSDGIVSLRFMRFGDIVSVDVAAIDAAWCIGASTVSEAAGINAFALVWMGFAFS